MDINGQNRKGESLPASKKLIGAALWGAIAGVLASYGLYWCFPYQQCLLAGLFFFILAPISMKVVGEGKTISALTFLTVFCAIGLVGALVNWGLSEIGLDSEWIGPTVTFVALTLALLATRRRRYSKAQSNLTE